MLDMYTVCLQSVKWHPAKRNSVMCHSAKCHSSECHSDDNSLAKHRTYE
jgi:hypothetical protein